MCLQVFVNAGAQHPVTPAPELVDGARRLGAAFQDVNFLRDLDHDETALGRDYLGVRRAAPTRDDVLDRIDADLAAAAADDPAPAGRLPARRHGRARPVRRAVGAAARRVRRHASACACPTPSRRASRRARGSASRTAGRARCAP